MHAWTDCRTILDIPSGAGVANVMKSLPFQLELNTLGVSSVPADKNLNE
jgi:hypothetical protein